MMLPNCPPSQTKINVLRFLRYPRRLLLPNWSPSSRAASHEQCDISCTPSSPDPSQLLLQNLDLSFMNNPGTPPEQLVVAVQNLKPFLPSGCEVLGEEDLKISGPYPASEGGFASVWIGEMKDGTTVAIKSQRRYSLSSSLPAFSVSGNCHTTNSNIFSSLVVIYRGCTGKR